MSRQQRQREELLSALHRGDGTRSAVLAREHLDEFPHDEAVRHAVTAFLADGRATSPADADGMRLALAASAPAELEGFGR